PHAVCTLSLHDALPISQAHRRAHGVAAGVAVVVQSMVFGNMGEDSATGVAFTRDPVTGARSISGEFLVGAQGEEVISSAHTPAPDRKSTRLNSSHVKIS